MFSVLFFVNIFAGGSLRVVLARLENLKSDGPELGGGGCAFAAYEVSAPLEAGCGGGVLVVAVLGADLGI